jgi:lysozyme
MIGFHYQGNSDGWTDAVRRLPAGTPVKFVDGVQRAVEAKGANPKVYTVIRHHVAEQNPSGDLYQKARQFFASFVDESFRQIAWAVDAVQEWNEYFSDSQDEVERARWVAWIQAAVDVWRDEYRTQPDYAHIDLILAETAVGNNIPVSVAKIAHNNPFCLIGYHPYLPVHDKYLHPEHWRWYSGRWETMDQVYRQAGYTVRWFFGEFGAVGVNGDFDVEGVWPNSLDPTGGWRHPRVFDGKVEPYLDMMTEWMSYVEDTDAWQNGRITGAVIFTSGGGSMWRDFEVRQPEMSIIAAHVSELMQSIVKPVETPPTPPQQPQTGTGDPRLDYKRVYNLIADSVPPESEALVFAEAAKNLQTVGWSADDAGIGKLSDKTVVIWGLPAAERVEYSGFFETHYPGTKVKFRDLPSDGTMGTFAWGGVQIPNDVGMFVDVSRWQGDIDWKIAREAGVTDAYIKVTQGNNWVDPAWMKNVNGCIQNGIRFGLYHYWDVAPLKREAQVGHFIKTIMSNLAIFFSGLHYWPLVVDFEEKSVYRDEGLFDALVEIEERTKKQAAIYTSPDVWKNMVSEKVVYSRFPLWLAQWGPSYPPAPFPWTQYFLHQTGSAIGMRYGAESLTIDVNVIGRPPETT